MDLEDLADGATEPALRHVRSTLHEQHERVLLHSMFELRANVLRKVACGAGACDPECLCNSVRRQARGEGRRWSP